MKGIQTNVQKLKNSHSFNDEQENYYQHIQQSVSTKIRLEFTNYKEEISNLENIKLTSLMSEVDNLKVRQEKLEQQDSVIISDTLKILKEPERKNQYLYYLSFCPRILTFIEACSLIQTNLIQGNKGSALGTSTEYLMDNINTVALKVAPLLGSIPIVGTAIENFFDLLDYGFGCYKDNKFNNKIETIMSDINKSQLHEREREVQLASFKIIEELREEDSVASDIIMYKSISSQIF